MKYRMTYAKFRTLGRRDYENGAVTSEIANSLRLLDSALQLLREVVETPTGNTQWDMAVTRAQDFLDTLPLTGDKR